MSVSIIWVVLHTSALTGLIIWVAVLDSKFHLPHWENHRFTFHENPALFFTTTFAMLVLGVISIFFLWRLKEQVKTFGGEEDNLETIWGPKNKCALRSIKPVNFM